MRPNWFVGLPVDPAGWLEPLLADAPRELRLFHPDDLHITVAFLGPVSEAAALDAWETAEGYQHAAIGIRLGELRGFGPRKRPSALSLVLTQGHEETSRLIAELRTPMLAAASARPDERPPLPHVTVARPARNARPPERRASMTWAESKGSIDAEVTLDRLALYTWAEDRRRGGRQFRIESERIIGR